MPHFIYFNVLHVWHLYLYALERTNRIRKVCFVNTEHGMPRKLLDQPEFAMAPPS